MLKETENRREDLVIWRHQDAFWNVSVAIETTACKFEVQGRYCLLVFTEVDSALMSHITWTAKQGYLADYIPNTFDFGTDIDSIHKPTSWYDMQMS